MGTLRAFSFEVLRRSAWVLSDGLPGAFTAGWRGAEQGFNPSPDFIVNIFPGAGRIDASDASACVRGDGVITLFDSAEKFPAFLLETIA